MASENLLWVDKHRPSTFNQLSYHPDLTDRLRHLASTPDIPHLLLYGPSGGGKRTRVACVLRALFGLAVEKKRIVHRVFKVGDTSRQVEVTTVASPHHVEVNPSESGVSDRLVVQELIKDMASSAPLDLSNLTPAASSNPSSSAAAAAASAAGAGSGKTIKIIVLHEVDQMSRLAQQALRRTMEKYSRTCRLILVAESASKLLEPLRSRCLGIRVPLPPSAAVADVLHSVARKEGVTLPTPLADRLVATSGRNMRRALLQFEATRVSVGALALPPDAPVMLGDWEYACQDVAVLLTRQQSAAQLVAVRKRFQELLAHAIPPDVVLRRLVDDILRIADDEIAPEICRVAAKFDRNLANGSKPIFHLEAFAARFMQVYSQFLRAQAAMID